MAGRYVAQLATVLKLKEMTEEGEGQLDCVYNRLRIQFVKVKNMPDVTYG